MLENQKRFPVLRIVRIGETTDSVRKRLAWSRSAENTGFTLMELLIVMAIISVLATIAYYKYSDFIDRTKETKAIADLKEIARLIEEYKERTGNYPKTLLDLERGEFKDPWGYPYQYVNIIEDDKKASDKQRARRDRNQKPINTYFDLWSNGADGDCQQQVTGAKSRDDVIYAWDGQFVGLGKDLDELYGKPRAWKYPADNTPEEDKGKAENKDTEPSATTVPLTTDPDKGKGGGKK